MRRQIRGLVSLLLGIGVVMVAAFPLQQTVAGPLVFTFVGMPLTGFGLYFFLTEGD